MTTLADALRSAIWARALTPAELALVQSEITEREIPAGGYACREGEPVNHWIGVVEGLVKLGVISPEGKPAATMRWRCAIRASRSCRAPASPGCSTRTSDSAASCSTS